MNREKLSVVKIGGNIIEDASGLSEFMDLFAALPSPKILVHGGGKRATEMGKQLGAPGKLVGGRRITDAQSLEIVVMVYAGLLNKKMVAGLQSRQCNAIGLCGADGNTIFAHKRPVKDIDFGFVGDVDGVGTQTIVTLLEGGLIPVFCALTHDMSGQLLNTNADTIASEIAIGMSNTYDTTLFYCFEKQGVLLDRSNEESVIPSIDSASYMKLLHSGVIAEGMLPKLENCFHALKNRVSRVCIGDIHMFRPGFSRFTTLTL